MRKKKKSKKHKRGWVIFHFTDRGDMNFLEKEKKNFGI